MQSPAALVLVAALAVTGCALLGFGPARSRVQGWVYGAESQAPLANAEVCAFGEDTTCVRADRNGHYSMKLSAQVVVLRFRYGALTAAASDTFTVIPPQRYTMSCTLTNRLVVSEHPIRCAPAPIAPSR